MPFRFEEMTVKSTNRDAQRLLQDLGHALAEAITSSADVAAAVRRLRNRGYTLNLMLDCQQGDGASTTLALTPGGGATLTPAGEDQPGVAQFMVDGQDVAMLKAMGIDATRPARRRRS